VEEARLGYLAGSLLVTQPVGMPRDNHGHLSEALRQAEFPAAYSKREGPAEPQGPKNAVRVLP